MELISAGTARKLGFSCVFYNLWRMALTGQGVNRAT